MCIRDRCYSQWIRHSYNTFVVKESAPGFMEMFDNRNLMAYLDDHESFVYRHRTLPNRAGMEYFEARAVRLYSDDDSYKIILGYRPIDDLSLIHISRSIWKHMERPR